MILRFWRLLSERTGVRGHVVSLSFLTLTLCTISYFRIAGPCGVVARARDLRAERKEACRRLIKLLFLLILPLPSSAQPPTIAPLIVVYRSCAEYRSCAVVVLS